MKLPNIYHPHTKYEGRYCFYRCLSVNISGEGGTPSGQPEEGYSIPAPGGGYPIQLTGGLPHPRSRQGGTPSQVWTGVPPIQNWIGYPLSRTGWGNPLLRTEWDTPPPQPSRTRWYTPPPLIRRQQHSEHLLRGMSLAFTQDFFVVV